MEPVIESSLEAIKEFVGQEKVQRALAITSIYLPYILVSLIAFPLASHAALRLWLALRQLPTPYRSEEAIKSRRRGYFLLIAYTVLLYVVMLYINLYTTESSLTWPVFFVPFITFATFLFLGFGLGMVPYSAHRTVHGTPWAQRVKGKKLPAIMTLFVSATTAIGGIVYGAPLYLWIGFTAMTFLNARAQPHRRAGSRTVIHVYLFVQILQLINIFYPDALEHTLEFITEANATQPMSAYIFNWWIPSLFVALPGTILSVALRFDHAQHIEANPELDDCAVLPTVAVTSKYLSKLVAEGVVIPARAPHNFRKTYYRAGFIAWGVSQVIALLTFALSPIERNHSAPAITFVWHFVRPSIVFMTGTICFVALLKGDSKKLLAYTETWTVKPMTIPAIDVTPPEDLKDEKVADQLVIIA